MLNPDTNRRAVTRLAFGLTIVVAFAIMLPIAGLRAFARNSEGTSVAGLRPMSSPLNGSRPSEKSESELRTTSLPEFATVTPAASQNGNLSIVFQSRAYQPVGVSRPKWYEIRLPDLSKNELSDEQGIQRQTSCNATMQRVQRFAKTLGATSPSGQEAELQTTSTDLRIRQRGDGKEMSIPLPNRGEIGERWNYPTSIAWSPDEKFILVGSEAGSSTSHFEHYWLLTVADRKWRYAGGGNGAIWSPDSSMIAWTTPRELVALGKLNVWVVHLVLVNTTALKAETVTSGVTDESNFFWCKQ